MARPNGYVFWEGHSLLVPTRKIIAVATGFDRPSNNRKTGDVIQTWVLVRSVDPVRALKLGLDRAVCGSCPLRRRWCYVNVGQAPLAIWRAYHGGRYPELFPTEVSSLLHSRPIRLGSYGDPAAVPTSVWSDLLRDATSHVGYTHQWQACDPELKQYCMASVENLTDAIAARTAGWRTFRVVPCLDDATRWTMGRMGEFTCPASAAGGHLKRCVDCRACRGVPSDKNAATSVVIEVHGRAAASYRSQRERKVS